MDALSSLPPLSARAQLVWQTLLQKYHQGPSQCSTHQTRCSGQLVKRNPEQATGSSVFESSQMSGDITWTQDHQRQRVGYSLETDEDPLQKQHFPAQKDYPKIPRRFSLSNPSEYQKSFYQNEDIQLLTTNSSRPKQQTWIDESPASSCNDQGVFHGQFSPEENENPCPINREVEKVKEVCAKRNLTNVPLTPNNPAGNPGSKEEICLGVDKSLTDLDTNYNSAKDQCGTFEKMMQASRTQKDVFRKPNKANVIKKRKHPEESEADKALSDIEQIMTSSEKRKRPEKANFSVPFKNVQKATPRADSTEVRCVTNLNEEDRGCLRTRLKDAPELALTLTYTDASSLLGPAPRQGKLKKSNQPQCLDGLIVAFPQTDSEQSLDFIKFVLDGKNGLDAWSREVLSEVMKGKSRKICYRADELMVVLQKCAGLNQQDASLQWSVLDPGVAFWLLHSDHPARSFSDIIEALPNILSKPDTPLEEQTTVGWLRLLGPAMAQLYRLLKSAHLWDMFLNLETPLTPILVAMHLRGIKVDTTELVKTANLLERKLAQLEEAAHMLAGRRFSLNSHPQLRQVLFEDLKLDKKLEQGSKIARTLVEGQKSTSQSVLLQLRGTHELPAIVLEYRQLQKLKSTYVDGLLSCVESSGWVHARWTQVSASTGRLAATHPNLQAVPKLPMVIDIAKSAIVGDSPEQVSIFARDPFHSQPGYTLLAADFQQVEFRLLAHLSSDQSLLSIFNENPENDIFVQLTAQWLTKLPSEVTAADREQTKRVVYSVIYGAGKERLSDYLKIEAEEAKDIIHSFLVKYPGVNAFTKSCISEAQRQGHQTTLFGRRRLLPHINHPAPNVRAQAERQAVNFCIQGSAADLCKAAMIMVEKVLSANPHLDTRLLLQIHDELLFEVKDEQLQNVADLIKMTMEDREALCGSQVCLQVPLPVSLSCGQMWGHMDPYRPPK